MRITLIGHRLIALALAAAASSGTAATGLPAQGAPGGSGGGPTGVIRGRVVEEGSGRPLGQVQVLVAGTMLGGITSASGSYVLTNVPAGQRTVRTRLIGYAVSERTVDVTAGGATTVDLTLSPVAISLDEVVVTGVPGATTKRSLGNSIATVDAGDLTQKTVTTNVTELLQAKAPGVTIMRSSGTPGTAGTIRIRGIGSLVSSAEPVVYVDGVRIASGAAGNFRNSWESPAAGMSRSGGGQDGSLLDVVNPDEIESIEVIKGPAAATLYGADAANGVIQIITKRGKPGEQKLQWRTSVRSGQTDWALSRRESYTTCTAERIAAQLPSGGAAWPGCQGRSPGSVISMNSLEAPGALRAGTLANYALSMRGGGQGYGFFASADHDREQGVVPNNEFTRSAARANLSFFPSDAVNFLVNFGVARSETSFPQGDNATNLLESAWTFQPGASLGRGQADGFAAGSPGQIALYDNRLTGNRVTFGTTLNVTPFPWFQNRLIVGGDINAQQANRYVAPGSLWAPSEGQMSQGAPRNDVYTIDYAGTVTSGLPLPSLTSALSVGFQYTNKQFRNTIAQGNNFPSGSARDINLSATRYGWSEFSEVKSLGVYAQEQLAWRDRLYLTGALRVDNSSVFGDDIKQLYYPKLSAAYVLSEEPFLRNSAWLNQLKLRAAWGQAGNAPDPFAAVRSYVAEPNVDNTTGQAVPMLRLNTKGNTSIKPERGSEIELGFDAGFFGDRLGAEFTFYNKTTRDALMLVPIAPSEGFVGSVYSNLGEINNRGIELALTATPVSTRLVTWDSRLGLATNRNRLVRFGYDRDPVVFGLTTPNQRHAEGYALGGFWVHDPVKNSAGNWVAGEARYVGASNPTREVSFGNTFTIYKNLQLYALLDYKGGFHVLNQTDWRRCTAGVCWEVNDPNRSALEKEMLRLDLGVNDALYTQKGDFIKLRDVSLTYTLPGSWLGALGADRAAFTVAGHNLGFLWKPHYTGLDPEVNFAGDNGPTGAWSWTRVDYWTMPMTRRITAGLDFSF